MTRRQNVNIDEDLEEAGKQWSNAKGKEIKIEEDGENLWLVVIKYGTT